MKKKLLFLTVLVMAFVCLFVVSASAKTIYKDADGNTLFSYVDEDGDFDFDSYEGSFPKTDANGKELTWYITATTTDGSDTVHTVTSLLTVGEAGSINSNGAYSFTSPVTKKNVVSVNFPDNSGIKSFAFNSFGGNGTRGSDTAVLVNNVLFVYCPNTLTTLAGDQFQETSVIFVELDDETPIDNIPYKFAHEARNLETVNIPKAVTVINGDSTRNGTPFYNCWSLVNVTFADGINLIEIKNNCFKDCKSLTSIDLPDSIQAIGDNAFAGCSSLKEISLPNSLKTIKNHAFGWCTSLEVIRMGNSFQYFNNTGDNSFTYSTGNVKEIYIPKSFYATAPDTSLGYQVSYAFHGVASNCKFFYCGTTEEFETAKANFLTQKSATSNNSGFINASVITYDQYLANPDSYATGRYVICEYSNCDAFYKGEHIIENVDSCMSIAECTRNGCTYETTEETLPKSHKVVASFVYEDGFGNKGYYTCVCENAAYCTAFVNEEEYKGYTYSKGEATDPIITFKGYSVPEKETKLAINVGYEIDYTLLTKYEKVTGEEVKLSLFMVNSQTKDNEQNKVNISAIFKNEALDFADGVNGFCVQVNKSSYNSISLTIKGFDKGENYDGSYYALKLISAIVVQTTKDAVTSTHYVQATLDTTDKITLDNFDFVIITASAVYKDPIPTTQE